MRVLWGIGCLELSGPMTAEEIVYKFREAMSLDQSKSSSSRGLGLSKDDSDDESDNDGWGTDRGEKLPHVDLYRLIPISAAEHAKCRLADEDRIVAHLSNSTFGCREIEELHRQREHAELRLERTREALEAMMTGDGSNFEVGGEGSCDASGSTSPPSRSPHNIPKIASQALSSSTSESHNASAPAASRAAQTLAPKGPSQGVLQGTASLPVTAGPPLTSPRSVSATTSSGAGVSLGSNARGQLASQATQQQMCHLLKQENKVLRYKLDQSEVIRQETQETVEILRKEFMLLVHELMPTGQTRPHGQSPASLFKQPSATGGTGAVGGEAGGGGAGGVGGGALPVKTLSTVIDSTSAAYPSASSKSPSGGCGVAAVAAGAGAAPIIEGIADGVVGSSADPGTGFRKLF